MSNKTKKPPFDRPLSAEEHAAMPDETIDYSDIPKLDDAFFEGAIERPAPQKRTVMQVTSKPWRRWMQARDVSPTYSMRCRK